MFLLSVEYVRTGSVILNFIRTYHVTSARVELSCVGEKSVHERSWLGEENLVVALRNHAFAALDDLSGDAGPT